MIVSTKGRYAMQMLLDLARNEGDGYVSLKGIAERQGISLKYLEQIVMLLGRGTIVQASRGYQGGYRLARKPDEISIGEVLQLTEGSMAPVSCMQTEQNSCERCDDCDMLPVWEGFGKVINDYLDGITLQDVLDGKAGGTLPA